MRLGSAPVNFGVYRAEEANPPYALVLDQIAAAGYSATELGPYGYGPTEPDALANELRRRNLQLASSFVGLPLAEEHSREESVEACLRVARLLASQGVREIIIADHETTERKRVAGRVASDGRDGWNESQWQVVAATLHAIADAVGGLRMRVVVHHHSGTGIESLAEVERLLALTDPRRVNLLLDTGHATYGGWDPIGLIERQEARIDYVHLKDVNPKLLGEVRAGLAMDDAWREGVFCLLGEGLVDFPRLMGKLRDARYDGWLIVEQDTVLTNRHDVPVEFTTWARKNREYLRAKCGVWVAG